MHVDTPFPDDEEVMAMVERKLDSGVGGAAVLERMEHGLRVVG